MKLTVATACHCWHNWLHTGRVSLCASHFVFCMLGCDVIRSFSYVPTFRSDLESHSVVSQQLVAASYCQANTNQAVYYVSCRAVCESGNVRGVMKCQ